MTSGLNKPIYVRIQEYIAELILSGKLAPDSKIPSERDFSEDLGVSRMTVRKALTELVGEGLLERRHGSGTYVARPRMTYASGELVSYTKAMKNHNLATASQLLEFGEVAASRRLAEQLELEIGQPHLSCRHLAFCQPRSSCSGARFFSVCPRVPNLEEWDLEKSSICRPSCPGVWDSIPARISQTVEAVVGRTRPLHDQLARG